MEIYTLTRQWFDWCFDNPEKISPNHSALYFFILEHSNRLGWKEKFGLPTTMAKDAIGIKSYNTYIKTLRDLVEWGFIKMVQISKNQYSSNIIALSKNVKAHTKALDKALIKHASKQVKSTEQSIDSIDIQVYNDTSLQYTDDDTKEEVLVHPFSNDFLSAWDEWKSFKKSQHKFSYKSIKTEQAAINDLIKISGKDEFKAKEIINQSIAKGWKGFFDLPKNNSYKQQTQDQPFNLLAGRKILTPNH